MTKLNTVATRIQTRLSRKGVKVTLGDIKEYLKVNVSDVENITDVDVNLATNYFVDNATQLTVINEELSTEVDNVNSVNNEEIVISGESAIAPDAGVASRLDGGPGTVDGVAVTAAVAALWPTLFTDFTVNEY